MLQLVHNIYVVSQRLKHDSPVYETKMGLGEVDYHTSIFLCNPWSATSRRRCDNPTKDANDRRKSIHEQKEMNYSETDRDQGENEDSENIRQERMPQKGNKSYVWYIRTTECSSGVHPNSTLDL